jgi:hypothetical protein
VVVGYRSQEGSCDVGLRGVGKVGCDYIAFGVVAVACRVGLCCSSGMCRLRSQAQLVW